MKNPDLIIAIGASAGGMEEINTFFDHTPLDGVAYIIVQHLSADFKSRMVELLARHSKLEVNEAEDNMVVESNQVYLIPNNKFMTIGGGRLHLTDKGKTQTPHLTINTFFNSLAANYGNKAIAIVLSGLGSDGSEGIRAVKNAGGMVIARNPETSEFSSMPASAIATGVVDFILDPELMPNAIEDYIKYGGGLLMDNKDDEKNVTAIVNLIKERLPYDFSEYKQTTILRRTKRRAAQGNFTTLEAYLNFLKTAPEEAEALAKDFLISVTSFFRDKEAFEYIQYSIIPDMLKRITPGEELKLWVAGCATGEEVYSLAILLQEQLTGDFADIVVKIFATDIDSVALAQAGKAVYGAGIEKDVSTGRLENFFVKEGEGYRVKPALRKMVIFAHHDLVKNPPYCNMHFISCRNLLIYMTPVLQKRIFAMLLFGLKMDGYLFLGSSENPMPIIKNLEVVDKKWKIYRNLEKKRALHFDAFSFPELIDVKRSPSLFSKDDASRKSGGNLAEVVNESLVNTLGYLVICIDENGHVIKTFGDTTKYLLQKNFTTDIAELLPKPLAVAFNTLSAKALETNGKEAVKGIKTMYGETLLSVALSIGPLPVKTGAPKLLMATFSEDKMDDPAQAETVFDEKLYVSEYTLNIEEELRDLKEKLSATYEQLDASNENMQSFNEELISANEEMQSTNEEMQSVNEELDTINSNYQLKNKELLEMNDDLNNYFRSNINGQLFVNNDMVLMKFSPGTVKLINLLDTDIGRPISNISTNMKLETIADDVKKVLGDGIVITKETEANDGKWYQIMTMPYIKQVDNKVNGAIITFTDISALKKAQQELDKKNKTLLRINADLDNFVLTASHDLLAPLNNIEASINVINQIKTSEDGLKEFLRIINSSVKNFRALIRDIATIAKVENDMLITETVNIGEIIDDIEWSLEYKIKTSNALIARHIEVTDIVFSKKNFRSILFNLVSNGIKFQSDKSPMINIQTTKNKDSVILSVEDNGVGIPNTAISRIFEKYGRLNQDVEGQGVGLYLVKKIVDSAGGSIALQSELGKGSKFTITFNAEAM